jgi:hypothetical protein
VDGAYPVEAAEPVERDPIGARPVLWTRQPPAQLLPAHKRRLGRDPDYIGVAGQSDRGEHAAIPEPRDHDTLHHDDTLTYEEGHPLVNACSVVWSRLRDPCWPKTTMHYCTFEGFDSPSRHRFGPRDVSFIAKRIRHGPVAFA